MYQYQHERARGLAARERPQGARAPPSLAPTSPAGLGRVPDYLPRAALRMYYFDRFSDGFLLMGYFGNSAAYALEPLFSRPKCTWMGCWSQPIQVGTPVLHEVQYRLEDVAVVCHAKRSECLDPWWHLQRGPVDLLPDH